VASAAVQARTFVASQLRLRQAPTLEFVPDTVPGQGARIDRLLAELEGSGEPPTGAPVNQSPGSDQKGSGA
jgi:ribosome-binding factor A